MLQIAFFVLKVQGMFSLNPRSNLIEEFLQWNFDSYSMI